MTPPLDPETLTVLRDFAEHGLPAHVSYRPGTGAPGMGDCGDLDPASVAELLAEFDRLRESVATEWYNGNVDEGARDRILTLPRGTSA